MNPKQKLIHLLILICFIQNTILLANADKITSSILLETKKIHTDKYEVYLNDQQKIFKITSSKNNIKKITINTEENIETKRKIKKLVDNFIYTPNTKETHHLIKENIIYFLTSNDYLHSNVDVHTDLQNKAAVIVNVTFGEKCTANKITHNLSHNNFDYLFNKIQYCNTTLIKNSVRKIEKKLQNLGHLDAKIYFSISQPLNNKVNIHLDCSMGKKIIFETKLIDVNYWTNLFREDPIKNLDLTYSSSSSIQSELENYYLEKGYYDISIIKKINTHSVNKTIYNYNITLGKKHYIFFEVQSTTNSSEFELNQYIHNKLNNNKTIYSPSNLNLLSDIINEYYQILGFWDAQILSSTVEKTNLRSVTVFFKTDTGKQRILKKINLANNSQLKDSAILKMFAVKLDTPYDLNKVFLFKEKINSHFRSIGFINSNVTITHQEINNTYSERHLLSNININQGKITIINKIQIENLKNTDLDFLIKYINFHPKQKFTEEYSTSLHEKLSRLGIFSSISFELVNKKDLDEATLADLKISLIEKNFGSISFGPKFDFNKGISYTSDITYSNLLAKAQKISLHTSISEEKEQTTIHKPNNNSYLNLLGRNLTLSYTDPYLFKNELSGKITLQHKEYSDTIWKIINSLLIDITYELDRFIDHATLITFYKLQYNNDRGAFPQKNSLTGKSTFGTIGFDFIINKKEPLAWPKKGFYLQSSISLADKIFYGDHHFIKYDLEISLYQSLIWDIIAALNFIYTSYNDIDNQQLPSTLRIQLGGSDKIQGFEDKLGSYLDNKNKDIIGGNIGFMTRAELRYTIIKDSLAFSLFYNLGNSFFSEKEAKKFTKNKEKNEILKDNYISKPHQLLTSFKDFYSKNYSSFGISLNILTAIGTINISTAFPHSEPKYYSLSRTKKPGDLWWKNYQLNFTIGANF
jgi:outer membrane protein assembly factor BamA